jgi:hypothetical protein
VSRNSSRYAKSRSIASTSSLATMAIVESLIQYTEAPMDPLLFGIDGQTVAEVLGTIVLLSLFVERALSIVFEWRPLVHRLDHSGFKEPIALAASFAVVAGCHFDALAILFKEEHSSFWGYVLTAAVVAGGSKGAIKLFRDWFDWKSTAYRQLEEQKQASSGT